MDLESLSNEEIKDNLEKCERGYFSHLAKAFGGLGCYGGLAAADYAIDSFFGDHLPIQLIVSAYLGLMVYTALHSCKLLGYPIEELNDIAKERGIRKTPFSK